jgi:hypothetical protein
VRRVGGGVSVWSCGNANKNSKWVKFIYRINITEKQTYNERTTSVMNVTFTDIGEHVHHSLH